MADRPPTALSDTTAEQISRAAACLRRGELVAFPTETVYGLGADATSDAAVARVYAVKGRPSNNPLIVHVADPSDLASFVHVTPLAMTLTKAFWPGPLTVVLDRLADGPIASSLSAGLSRLAIRCPAHPVARDLIRKAGVPIAAPSANRSGEVSPTRAEHVQESLGDGPAMILDGGLCAEGLESTVVDASGDQAVLLRPGMITLEQIEAVVSLQSNVIQAATGDADQDHLAKSAPGMLSSHYAPRLPLVLNQTQAGPDDAVLAFAGLPPGNGVGRIDISPKGHFDQAACHLYDAMRMLDRISLAKRIVAGPVPERGLGMTINDRLRRAAIPHDRDDQS